MKKVILLSIFLFNLSTNVFSKFYQTDSLKVDREYYLEATMLGYFAKDGARNPTLKAKKGETVRITIKNGEVMTHDIALEKMGTKSKTIFEKGNTTSIIFKAIANDIYYCTVPGHKAAGMVGKFEILNEISTKQIVGILPTKNGKSLNLNFETGDIRDWTATGDAFKESVFKQNLSSVHEKDANISSEGNYFLSSGGTKNHSLTGSITSAPFKVNKPFAAFKVSGGALQDTRIEIILEGSKKVIFQSTGQGRITLQPVVVDLKPYLNQNIYIKLIDNETGISSIPYIGNDKLAHINFDDFRFYSSRPNFTNELLQKDIIVLPPLDPILNSGLSGVEAAKAMTLPNGFKITLAASEPDVVKPISFTIDARNRLWVVEGHTYPVPAKEGEGRDRILILEDTDGDGVLDNKKIFMEGLNLVSGIEIGLGGLWLCAAPYLLFIPINFENDTPDGPPQKLLDGWGLDDTHEVLNNVRWGPDGWLYGCHGVFTHSNVGKVGATAELRTKINGGIWRYHPTKKDFEVFAEGTSNPWGIDFNDLGHTFATVCVIPHMFNIVQGAHFERQANKHFNPYIYDDIKNIGDHVHYLGDRGPHAGNFRSAKAGGGHAHAGAMIYLGGNTWPAEYRNTIFMNNINGAKLNNDAISRSGSGYIASHKNDFLSMNDSWSQWLNLKYDASGSVFAIDWYDKNQCHSANPDVHNKTMGRIFKITHEKDKWVKVDLRKASDTELVNFHLNDNEWYVRQSRTILQERGFKIATMDALKRILNTNPNVTRRLRAMWTLHVLNGFSEIELNKLLTDNDENIRAWAIQLIAESKYVSTKTLPIFTEMARNDKSPLVRLYLSSALLRLPLNQRWEAIEALTQHSEDIKDHNLPLMYWFVAEPLAELDPNRMIFMAEKTKMPKFLNYAIQRVGAINKEIARKSLKELKNRLSETHDNHENVMLLNKILNEY